MTLVGPIDTARRTRGPLISRIGTAGLIGTVLVTITAWLLVDDLFRRLDGTLEVTGSALQTIGVTLDIADEALANLTLTLEVASAATNQASASAATVSEAIDETVVIIGEDLPASIEAIRAAMPGLIEASAVIDSTLSGLALVGVPYNPEVPLDDAFRDLDRQLASMPQSLRDNAATIGELVPQADGFRDQSTLLATQVGLMRTTVENARTVIDDYRVTTDQVDVVVRTTTDGLGRSELTARLLVVLVGVMSALTMSGFVVVGRALTTLEAMPG
ncbi:MAG: hypothetical protein WD651_08540 [Acidimicrobiia bacterium]